MREDVRGVEDDTIQKDFSNADLGALFDPKDRLDVCEPVFVENSVSVSVEDPLNPED